MASSAVAAHMVHLCSIWATPWEQYEICQCQSQALCAHPCIPATGVRRITTTASLRISTWSRTQGATEDEKRVNHLAFRDTGGLQTWVKVPGTYRHSFKPRCCVALHRSEHCLLSRSWQEHGWWRLSDWTGKIQRSFPQHYSVMWLTLG